MPNHDQEPIETDGDPRTIYEDTTPHTRSGFMPEQPDITAYASDNGESEEDQTRS
ncbi:hypothetical protein MJ257_07715 [Paenibacillus timonensis]|uniref:Multidrug transporter n=1 Tax=Paenibacillus timonensis TaxID=225915 RepID=A0ABW3SCN5_9BACL|nr:MULTISPECIES: hypothetical protein [Paenibacillus]MCH1639987.1 hypothetical protein [Paenibacillus timonensis]MDU2241921.1 hypothetical protein [Paenibacillus sp.]